MARGGICGQGRSGGGATDERGPSCPGPRRRSRPGQQGAPLSLSVYLADGYAALLGQLLLHLLGGVRIGQVAVEVLAQDLCGLLGEVSPPPPARGTDRRRAGSAGLGRESVTLPGPASSAQSRPDPTREHLSESSVSPVSPPRAGISYRESKVLAAEDLVDLETNIRHSKAATGVVRAEKASATARFSGTLPALQVSRPGGQRAPARARKPDAPPAGDTDPVYMSRKIRKFRTDKFDT